MRKLKSYNGMPYVFQVHAAHQDNLENAIKGVISHLGSKVILSGCVLTPAGGGNVSVSEGWISWDGELYFVGSHSYYNPANAPLVVYKDVSTTNYPELNADGTLKPMVETTNAKIKGAISPGTGEALWSDFVKYADVATTTIKSNPTAWKTVPASGTAAADKFLAPAATGSISSLQYRVLYENVLCIRGHFKVGQTGVASAVIFNLPSGYRPDRIFTCPALIANGVSQHFDSKIIINPNGNVEIYFSGTNSADYEYTFNSMICVPL